MNGSFGGNHTSTLGSGAADQAVYILHATFKEFLLREYRIERKVNAIGHEEVKIRNQYYTNKAEGERAMLKSCLSNVMAKGLVFNICRLETSCLLNENVTDMDDRVRLYISNALRYSCLNWASHLESIPCDAEILEWLESFMNNQFLWWLEDLSVTKCVGFASKILAVAFSHDSKWLVSGSYDRTVRVRDAGTGVAIEAPFRGHNDGFVMSVALTASELSLAPMMRLDAFY